MYASIRASRLSREPSSPCNWVITAISKSPSEAQRVRPSEVRAAKDEALLRMARSPERISAQRAESNCYDKLPKNRSSIYAGLSSTFRYEWKQTCTSQGPVF
jgi:hypothetical protein